MKHNKIYYFSIIFFLFVAIGMHYSMLCDAFNINRFLIQSEFDLLNKHLGGAEKYLFNIIAIHPEDVTARRVLSNIEFYRLNPDGVIYQSDFLVKQNPSDRFARQRLAQAYSMKGDYDTSHQIWQSLDFSMDELQHHTEESLKAKAYLESSFWLEQIIYKSSTPKTSVIFQYLFVAVMAGRGNQAEQFLKSQNLWEEDMVNVLGVEPLVIEAETMRAMSKWPGYGKSIMFSEYPANGIIWANYGAYALLSVAETGLYEIEIKARGDENFSIELALEINDQEIGHFVCEKGHSLLGNKKIVSRIFEGENILGIKFINDPFGTTTKPNAMIDWIKINYVKN